MMTPRRQARKHNAQDSGRGQSAAAYEGNTRFFRDHHPGYAASIHELDTYRLLRQRANRELDGVGSLCDIGNGGVFNYDIHRVEHITAVDLFLDSIDQGAYPAHIRFVEGDALGLPFHDGLFDAVFLENLLHHLVGTSVAASRLNVNRCFAECLRILKPLGRLIIFESCVPCWFERLQSRLYPAAHALIPRLTAHPPTYQYSSSTLLAALATFDPAASVERLPAGRWVLQLGHRWPTALTPARMWLFKATKRERPNPVELHR